jgi:hypothetical protein
MPKQPPPFKPLILHIKDPSDISEKYRVELAKKVIEALKYCLKFNLSHIVFGELETIPSYSIMQLCLNESTFLDSIEKNLKILEDCEEYELCAELVKIKKKVIKNAQTNSKQAKPGKPLDNLIKAINNI